MKFINDFKKIINTPDEEYMYSDDIRPDTLKISFNSSCELEIFKPETFEDSTAIAKSILSGKIVVIKLASTNREIARRIVDFLSGTTFERNIQIKRISNLSFIFASQNINIDDNFIYSLKEKDIEL